MSESTASSAALFCGDSSSLLDPRDHLNQNYSLPQWYLSHPACRIGDFA
jgi:hypothetical protein